jgi:hypothetical protein
MLDSLAHEMPQKDWAVGPSPDLRKLAIHGLSGHRPFDLLVLGREALSERAT